MCYSGLCEHEDHMGDCKWHWWESKPECPDLEKLADEEDAQLLPEEKTVV